MQNTNLSVPNGLTEQSGEFLLETFCKREGDMHAITQIASRLHTPIATECIFEKYTTFALKLLFENDECGKYFLHTLV